jgi:hypothetical protein
MLNMEEQQLERLRMDLSLRLKYDESILETSANNVRTLKRNYKGTMKAYVCTDEVADIIIGKHLESAHGTFNAVMNLIRRGFYGIPEELVKYFCTLLKLAQSAY